MPKNYWSKRNRYCRMKNRTTETLYHLVENSQSEFSTNLYCIKFLSDYGTERLELVVLLYKTSRASGFKKYRLFNFEQLNSLLCVSSSFIFCPLYPFVLSFSFCLFFHWSSFPFIFFLIFNDIPLRLKLLKNL